MELTYVSAWYFVSVIGCITSLQREVYHQANSRWGVFNAQLSYLLEVRFIRVHVVHVAHWLESI